MTEPYPPPSHAATVWLTGDCLAIATPGGKTTFIPLRECAIGRFDNGKPLPSQLGWHLLLQTLQDLRIPEQILAWRKEHQVTICPPGARSIDPGAGGRFQRPTRSPSKPKRTTLEDLA